MQFNHRALAQRMQALCLNSTAQNKQKAMAGYGGTRRRDSQLQASLDYLENSNQSTLHSETVSQK